MKIINLWTFPSPQHHHKPVDDLHSRQETESQAKPQQSPQLGEEPCNCHTGIPTVLHRCWTGIFHNHCQCSSIFSMSSLLPIKENVNQSQVFIPGIVRVSLGVLCQLC